MAKPTSVEDEFLNIRQVAENYRVSEKTVRRKLADGTIIGYKVGSLIRIKRSDAAAIARPLR